MASSRLRRHNSALVALTQRLWHELEGLDSALTAITETAAEVLDVDRVNVWQIEPVGGLRCVHDYRRSGYVHNPAGFDEVLMLDNTRYLRSCHGRGWLAQPRCARHRAARNGQHRWPLTSSAMRSSRS